MKLRNITYEGARQMNMCVLSEGIIAAKWYNVSLPPDLVESYIRKEVTIPIYKVVSIFGVVLSGILFFVSIWISEFILAFGYLCGLVFCSIAYKVLNIKERLVEEDIKRKLASLEIYEHHPEEVLYEEEIW